jgi:heat shock protein HslJ
MKVSFAIVVACAVLAVLIAGCTSQSPAPPVTTTPATTVPVTPTPASTQAFEVDPALLGTWTVREMGLQGGSAPVPVLNAKITAAFDDSGNLGGNGGCNGYGSSYTLSGRITEFGKEIAIGPIISTLMYCEATSAQETTYFQILQDAESYAVEGDQTLSIRSRLGSVIVFTRSS